MKEEAFRRGEDEGGLSQEKRKMSSGTKHEWKRCGGGVGKGSEHAFESRPRVGRSGEREGGGGLLHGKARDRLSACPSSICSSTRV